jgi:UDP-N-acetylmuramate dehydrogenase
MEPEIKKAITELGLEHVSFDAPLAGLTTFGLGGPAEVLAEPDSPEELTRLMHFIRAQDIPWFILGGGSNLLVRDGGVPGVVIRLGHGFAEIKIAVQEDHIALEAGAAAPTAQIVSLCRREGYAGLEFLAGIPGWIGGAVAMNAGTHEGQILDRVIRITCLNRDAELESTLRKDLVADYRSLELPEGTIILGVEFRLEQAAPEAVEAKVKDNLARRSATQPKGVKSAGCIFKNPAGDYAGRLIDEAGLKGKSAGRAWVSEDHANFIVHRGKATAEQVLRLIERVRQTILDKYNVELETEIRVVGVDREEAAE